MKGPGRPIPGTMLGCSRGGPGEFPGNLQIPWKNRIRGFPRIWPGVNGIFSGLPRETPGTSEGSAGASPARLGAYSNPSDLCPRPAGDGVGKSDCGKRQVRSSVEEQGRPIPRTMPGGSRGFPRDFPENSPGIVLARVKSGTRQPRSRGVPGIFSAPQEIPGTGSSEWPHRDVPSALFVRDHRACAQDLLRT